MAPKGFFHIIRLGCEKNDLDAESICAALERLGLEWTDEPESADIIFVNTCAFTAEARAEADEVISGLESAAGPGSGFELFVTGCLPQYLGSGIADRYPGARAFMGPGDPDAAARLVLDPGTRLLLPLEQNQGVSLLNPAARTLLTPPWRAFMKIGEGCDNNCAYCVIGRLRGRYRSRPGADLIEEARQLADAGVRELTIISQDSTAYGADLAPEAGLGDLLESLLGIVGLDWIRLLYLHPGKLSPEVVRLVCSEPRLCSYFDLPIQHIDDRILRAMGRGYDSERVRALLELIRGLDPLAGIRTSVIVGFPGEGEAEFERLCEFMEWAGFDTAGFFAWSPEPGTRAMDLPDRPPREAVVERVNALYELQQRASEASNSRRVGQEYRVLIEDRAEDGDQMIGRIPAQAPDIDGVTAVSGRHRPGDFVQVVITAAVMEDLESEPA